MKSNSYSRCPGPSEDDNTYTSGCDTIHDLPEPPDTDSSSKR